MLLMISIASQFLGAAAGKEVSLYLSLSLMQWRLNGLMASSQIDSSLHIRREESNIYSPEAHFCMQIEKLHAPKI